MGERMEGTLDELRAFALRSQGGIFEFSRDELLMFLDEIKQREKPMLTMTVAEILDLARFAGLMIDNTSKPSDDELESTIVIRACPPDGVKNEGEPSDPDSVSHYRYIAFYDEYPDEGCIGLGDELVAPSHD